MLLERVLPLVPFPRTHFASPLAVMEPSAFGVQVLAVVGGGGDVCGCECVRQEGVVGFGDGRARGVRRVRRRKAESGARRLEGGII